MAKEFLTNLIIGGKVAPSLAKAINKANEQSKVLKKIGNVGKAIGKATLATSAAAAAGIVAIAKSSVESYAEYEQLVGGIDTLFKESSAKVQQYASEAYKTAGMSANEYMNTATSFSASLLQSLGNDTAKATEYANQAIIDMSDNANKMGTDMDSIVATYQSLAKGNMGMLDNLKLGYGGTKAEMQRLLKDAEKLSGIKYDISSFSDITQAIHVIQGEMGISGRTAEEVADIYKRTGRVVEETLGTTAKEASTTIQGSISTMKSAWNNLITGLGNEDVDFDMLLTNMLESVGTVAENLLPRISVIIGKIPDLVRGLLPLIPPLVAELLPVAIEGVSSIISGVGAILPQLVSTVVSSIGQIISQSFAQMPTPMLIIAGAIAAITAGIAAYNAVVAIKNVVDKVQEQGMKKIVAAQIAQNAAFLASPIFWIIAAVVALVAVFVILWNKCEGFRNFWIGLWEGIKTAFFTVVNWIKENWQTMLLFLINPLAGIFKYCYEHFEGFRNVVNNVVTSVKGFFVNLWTNTTAVFSNVGIFFKEKFSAAWSAVKNVFASWGEFFGGLWNKIKTTFSTLGTSIANAIGGAVKKGINGVITLIENRINDAIRLINGGIDLINKIPGVSVSKVSELKLPRLATGGSFDGKHPQLAIVGDAPETMVPHGNTPRNRALLAEAARGVGGGLFGNVNITFAPVIQGGSGSDVRQALKDSEIEFERKMDEYFRKKGRVSFA